MVDFLTAPFASLTNTDTTFKNALEHLLCYPLSIPLLPNRLLSSNALAPLSSHLPLIHLSDVNTDSLLGHLPSLEARIHLLANLCTFLPVSRISSLASQSNATVNAYVRLLTAIFNSLPPNALDAKRDDSSNAALAVVDDDSSDSDSDYSVHVMVVDSFQPKVKLPTLDPRTLSRVQTLRSPSYINAILASMQRYQAGHRSLYSWGLALCRVWPNQTGEILGVFVVHGGGGLVRELYRGYVRASSIGNDRGMGTLSGSSGPSSVLLRSLTRFKIRRRNLLGLHSYSSSSCTPKHYSRWVMTSSFRSMQLEALGIHCHWTS